MSKFPNEIRLRAAREANNDVWEIDELLEVIKKEVKARETSEGTRVNPNKAVSYNSRSQAAANPTTSSFVTNSNTIRCVYCNGDHFSASCTKVVDISTRRDILKKTGRCFNCLKSHHKSRDCDSRKNCRHCHRRHHQSICEQLVNAGTAQGGSSQSQPTQSQNSQTSSLPSQTVTTSSCNKMLKNQTVLLQTARVVAISSHGAIPVRLLLDNGSQLSYITTSLQSRLKLEPLRKERLHLNTFGSDTFSARTCDVVCLSLQRPGYTDTIDIMACTSPTICSSLPALVDITKYSHLKDIELADNFTDHEASSIDVLIGSNYYNNNWSVVNGELRKGDSGPVAMNSIFGWLLSGPVDSLSNTSTFANHAHVIITDTVNGTSNDNQDDLLSRTLKRFWDTEAIGIHSSLTNEPSTLFPLEIVFDKIRYEVRLPWREDHPDVPDHLNLCRERLKYLHQKLLKKPSILLEYNNIITEQLSKGIIEVVPNPDIPIRQSSVHYLPHHAVIRQNKLTTKVRIVYDGSAKSTPSSPSINDCLMTGPNMIPKLFNILVKFRWNLIAVTADIEKAFLMIGIHLSDRDMLRFLWLKHPDKDDSELAHFRFTRLVFGLRPSPAILSCIISHHLKGYSEKYPKLVQSIENSLYVDDLIAGEDTVEQGFNLYLQAKRIMSDGSFNLRKWNSNSPELLTKIRDAERGPVSANAEEDSCNKPLFQVANGCCETEISKLLGITWNSSTDKFMFCFSELIAYVNDLPATKRSILKISAKIFDPLGLISPFVIRLKMLFQSLCFEGRSWDEPLTSKALGQWNGLTNELQILDKITIPRCYFLPRSVPIDIQLHGFSDASEHAYAAAVYLRSMYDDGTIISRLVASKTRVSPVKKQSIPRLELLGSLILARLID